MPLDDFQKIVLQVLMPFRTPESVFAGGSVLQRHGHRLSDDQDIFHGSDTNIDGTAKRDCEALREAGMNVDIELKREGFIEAIVGHETYGFTKIQWVEAGARNFFNPVPDQLFGFRLHMADLSVNKALAAGGRRAVRDYVDLAMIHEHVMPLWHVVWAAPAKDESWTPVKLLEKIAATNQFRQADLVNEVVSTSELSVGEIGSRIREAVEEAREVFAQLPGRTAGRLIVDASGHPVSDVRRILQNSESLRFLDAEIGGSWPSGPDIDAALIERLVDRFGWEGDQKVTKFNL